MGLFLCPPCAMAAPWQTEPVIQHTQRLLFSFEYWLGRSLLPQATLSPENNAQQLFDADFVLVSHGLQADPIFNYGNRQALALWELSWDSLIQMPSRKTAEVDLRADRAQMLTAALRKGYIEHYEGIRISSTGHRFRILDGIIWNVVDELGTRWGQAATFSRYEFL